jgi:hypothetical protein
MRTSPGRADHGYSGRVRALSDPIAMGQRGRRDVPVNWVWGADPLTDWGHFLWGRDLDAGIRVVRQAVETM